jgi:hypothetical protein
VATKPLQHYTKAGNIFQILRFGIQSNNFKNRINDLRANDYAAEAMAKQLCGLRIKQGGSYQGKDSISISNFDASLFVKSGNVLLLIDPATKTFGDDEPRDASSGYGYGIPLRNVQGYEIGNPTAYKTEVIAANIVLPEQIKAVVVGPYESILSDMTDVVRQNVSLYLQQRDARHAAEDLLATCRLLDSLTEADSLEPEIQALQEHMPSMDHQAIISAIISLQKRLLQSLVGAEKLTEQNLRGAIERMFGIKILQK